jgi:hypothetical protein
LTRKACRGPSQAGNQFLRRAMICAIRRGVTSQAAARNPPGHELRCSRKPLRLPRSIHGLRLPPEAPAARSACRRYPLRGAALKRSASKFVTCVILRNPSQPLSFGALIMNIQRFSLLLPSKTDRPYAVLLRAAFDVQQHLPAEMQDRLADCDRRNSKRGSRCRSATRLP